MRNILKNIYIAIIALFGISLYVLLFPKTQPYDRSIAIIEKDGTIIQKIDLKDVTEPYFFYIEDDLYPATLKVECGKISFVDAHCPDKLCQKTGIISRPHQAAICLPARICVYIEGENNEFDSITG